MSKDVSIYVEQDNGEMKEVKSKLKPLTNKRIKELKKIESEDIEQEVLLEKFFELFITPSETVDFDRVDLAQFIELVHENYHARLNKLGK